MFSFAMLYYISVPFKDESTDFLVVWFQNLGNKIIPKVALEEKFIRYIYDSIMVK